MYAHTDGQTTTQKHNDSGSIYRMDGGIKILKDCRNYSERFHHPPKSTEFSVTDKYTCNHLMDTVGLQ